MNRVVSVLSRRSSFCSYPTLAKIPFQSSFSSFTTASRFFSTESATSATTSSRPPRRSNLHNLYQPDEKKNVNQPGEIYRRIHFPVAPEGKENEINPKFRELVNELFNAHQPSKHSFFSTLKNADKNIIMNKGFLNEFYFRYQAAMHATRAMVYFTPHLNSPTLRQRKIAVIQDDDTTNCESHHQLLENMFQRFGADPIDKEVFGDLPELAARSDPETRQFIETVHRLYPQSTGAWCIAEVLSDDWLSALADSFSPFFSFVFKEEYFDEVLTGHVEIEHMIQTLGLTENVLKRYPKMEGPTIAHAREMAANLDKLWDNLEGLIKNPGKYLTK